MMNNTYCTFYIGKELFAMSTATIQEVMKHPHVTRVPLAPEEIIGAMNIRGQIVVSLDLARRLGMNYGKELGQRMSIVVRVKNEVISLAIDQVGEVIELAEESIDQVPQNIGASILPYLEGVYVAKEHIVPILNIEKIIKKSA